MLQTIITTNLIILLKIVWQKKIIRYYERRWKGGVAEWLKATVLKTVDGRLSVSSNLTSSAKFKKTSEKSGVFFRLQIAVYTLVYKLSYL